MNYQIKMKSNWLQSTKLFPLLHWTRGALELVQLLAFLWNMGLKFLIAGRDATPPLEITDTWEEIFMWALCTLCLLQEALFEPCTLVAGCFSHGPAFPWAQQNSGRRIFFSNSSFHFGENNLGVEQILALQNYSPHLTQGHQKIPTRWANSQMKSMFLPTSKISLLILGH